MKPNLIILNINTLSHTIVEDIKIIINYINSLVELQKVVTLIDEEIISWDIEKNYNAKVIITDNRTLNLFNLKEGDYGTLEIIQGGVGGYTLILPTTPTSKVVGGGNGVITLTPSIGAIDSLTFYYNGEYLLWNFGGNYN